MFKFDHFALFFTFIFQLNVFIYALPLTVRLHRVPLVNIVIQLGLLATLKSYPNVGECGLYMCLLAPLSHLYPLMRNYLVYVCMLVASTVLAPVMLYLWLVGGGGNANFYFAITLVYSLGHMFLLVDVLYACLKREFIKENGARFARKRDGSLAGFSLE